jgi:hypothetical protein
VGVLKSQVQEERGRRGPLPPVLLLFKLFALLLSTVRCNQLRRFCRVNIRAVDPVGCVRGAFARPSSSVATIVQVKAVLGLAPHVHSSCAPALAVAATAVFELPRPVQSFCRCPADVRLLRATIHVISRAEEEAVRAVEPSPNGGVARGEHSQVPLRTGMAKQVGWCQQSALSPTAAVGRSLAGE